MKIYCLESGSKGNCTIIEANNHYLMIDCGGTKKYVFDRLKELNIELSMLDALLITHGHSDHIGLIKNFRNIKTLAAFDFEDYAFHQLSTHCNFRIGEFEITSLPLSHDYKPTIGYKIEVGGEVLVYITDTGYVNGKLFAEISNADYYIFESNHDPKMLMETNRDQRTKMRILSAEGHLCNEDAAQILSLIIGNKTKEIYLAHISRDANDYELPIKTLLNKFDHELIDYRNIRIESLKQYEITIGGNKKKE